VAIEEFTGQLDQERQPQAAQVTGAPRVEEFTGELDKETTKNPLMGGLARILDLGASGAEAIQRSTAGLRKGLEEGTPEALRSKFLSDEAVRQRQEAFTSSARQMSKDIGYEPSTSLADLGDNPVKVVPFVIERVITSSPDMAGAALAFTPYVMTRANEILNDRLKNDGKSYEQATVGDVAAATAGAIGEATLERFATKRILPGGKAVSAPAKEVAAPAAGIAALKRVGKEVGVQGGTESLEELASYGGETIGTKKGFQPGEAGERMLEAGIVGAGLGGGARGAREVYDYAKQPKIEELPPDAKVDPIATPMTKGERKDLEQEQDRAAAAAAKPAPVTGKEPWEEIADEFLKKPPVEEKPAEAELVKPPLEPISKPIDIPSNKGKIEGVDEIDLDPAELKLSKDVPQFKEDANEEGVVEPLQGKKYEYIGTPPIQVWRRLDGSLEVISGRHRLDLAKRTGADRIPAQVFDEAKGFNADMAAIMDAELNIRDGKGKVTDYVNYFREAGNRFGLTEKDYKDRGLLDSSKGKRAYAITVQGGDDLIQSLRGRQVTEDTAYRIADAVPNDARLQALGLKLVNEKPLEQAISILKAAKTIEPKQTEGGGEFDLFGFDDSAMKLAEDMGKLALKKQRELSDDILAIKPAAKRADKAAKGGVKVANPEKVLAEAKRLEELRSRWDNWASDPELVDQIRRELAGEVVEPVATETKPEKAPSKKPAKKVAEKKEKVEEKPEEKPGEELFAFELQPEQKQTAADKKAAAEREQKEIADREAEFFKLTPRTPEQGAGNYLQQDMIGAMGLTEAEFKKGIDKKSTEPGEPLILRNVTMEEHDTYNDDANQKVDQETIDLYGNMDDVKSIDVDEKNIEHTLSRQAKAVEEYVTMASQGKVTAEEFMKTVRAAAAKGDVSQDVLDSIEYMYKNFPSVLDGIRFEVVSGSKKTGAYREAGHYQPLARMIRLFKDTSGVMMPATVRHEIAHTMEQMMTPEQKRMVVRAWKDALIRATRAETTDEGHVFFQNVSKFLHDPKLGTLKAAIKSMPNVSYYQYINPSEYWAVNAEEILKSRTEGASSLRQSMEKLSQGLKQSFGMSNFWVGNRVFDQILNGDRFSNKMLLNYLSQTKMRNYLGEKAPLATWDSMGTNWLENKKYEYVDKYIDLLRAKQDIERMVGDVEEDVDAYTKETLSHSRISTKIKDFMRDHVAKLADVMRSNNISQQQLHEYLWARHAMDYNRVVGARNPEMGDNAAGISTDDAQNYIKSLGEARKAQLDKAAKEIDLMTQSTRNILLDSGYEKFDTLNAWQTMFPSYVPLYRKDLEYAGGKLGVGKGFSVQGKFSKAAMGSTKEVADISESVIRDHIRAIEKAERARVTRALYGMAIKHPNPSFWMAIDPRAVANPAETRKKLENIGVDPELIKNLMQPPKQGVINPETGLVEYRPSKVVLQSDNVVATRIDGEDVYVVFNNSDPRAARLAMAMKNMDLPDVEGFYRASAYVTRFFAMVNTQLNPIFGLWNFARDVQGAALNLSTTKLKGMEKEILKDSFSSVKDIYRAIRQERTTGERATTPGADVWYEFQSVGGTTGYKAQMVNPKSDVKVLEQAVKELNRGKPAKVVKWVGNWISDYNDTLENAVRLSSYKAALKKGMSQQEAANIAKNLTVNFNRKGAKSQVAGALFAFFNASVQGTSRLYQTLKGPLGKKIMFGGFLLGVAQSAMMALAGLEDDEPPEFVKEKNIIIPFGMFPGSDSKKYISFPMPLGYNVFPGIGRIFGEAVIGATQGKDVSKKFFDVLSLLANSFNPLGSSGLAWQTIMPTPLDPFMALAQNKDAFGRPIYKQDRETNPQVGYERTRDSTAALWKGMAEFINYMTGGTADVKGAWSPTGDEIAYLAGQAGGGIAREVGKIYGTASDFITGDETPSYKIPLIGKLYGDAESKAAVKNRFYTNVTKLAETERTLKGMQKRKENVSEYRKEHPEVTLINLANSIENDITDLNKRRKMLNERGATIAQIKRIEDIKEKKMRMLNERYDKIR